MRQELRVLGPVFLVLLAGYLATSFYDRDLSLSFSPLTGGAITDQSGAQRCPTDKILFKVSAAGNAHAELATHSAYGYAVCWDGQGSNRRSCTGTNAVVQLSAVTNAHVEEPTGPNNYPESACFGNIQCALSDRGTCSTLGTTWRCAASLSAETNAHVAECGVYPLDLCCSDGGGGSGGGGPLRIDTDRDGVFDEGLGATRFTPCNPRDSRFQNNFNICADNCINDPNPQQEDQDGDGSGDVCDAFPTDSCSILRTNDNCPHHQQCRNLVAQWSTTSVYEGDHVGLSVTGSAECVDKIAHFQVFDQATTNLLLVSPQPIIFTSSGSTSRVSGSWAAQYISTGTNRYYFQVTVTGGSSQIQTTSPSTELLTVNRRPAGQVSCGNGIIEGSNNEQCDDGNTGNNDGCSSTCQLEGGGAPGSCQDDPLCVGIPPTIMVCQSNPTQAYFCITRANGCRVLSDPLACGNSNSVQRVCAAGASSCRSPACPPITCTPWSSCANGRQTRACTQPIEPHCGPSFSTEQSCTLQQQQEEPFPVFTWWNILLTIGLLMTYYTFRRGARWKSR